MRVILSVYFWAFMMLSSLLLYPVAVIIRCTTFPFDKRLTILHRFTSMWGSLYTRCTPIWKVQIIGEEHLPGDTLFLFFRDVGAGSKPDGVGENASLSYVCHMTDLFWKTVWGQTRNPEGPDPTSTRCALFLLVLLLLVVLILY